MIRSSTIPRRTSIRFLVDECLSPKLVEVAEEHGYEAAHVATIGLAQTPDELIAMRAIAQGDIVVTNNARDYRRIYARAPAHPGLVIVLQSLARGRQMAAFRGVIAFIEAQPSVVDQMVVVRRDGAIGIEPWPRRDS